MCFLYLASVSAMYPASILIPVSWQYSLLYGLALYFLMHGSLYVPQSADVSVAVMHISEFFRAEYPAESMNGEGVPNGSMSIMSNLPLFSLRSVFASFCVVFMFFRLFSFMFIFSNWFAVGFMSFMVAFFMPCISFLYLIALIPLPPNRSHMFSSRFSFFWNVCSASMDMSLFSSIWGL